MSRAGRRSRGPSTVGLLTAAIFVLLAVTPSLLPRPWFLQAAVTGIAATLGYALGSGVGWAARRALPTAASGRVRALVLGAAVAVTVAAVVLGARWNGQVSRLMTLPEPPVWTAVAGVAGGLVLLAVLVGLGRGLAAVGRSLGRRTPSSLPRPARAATGGLAAVVLVALVGAVLWQAFGVLTTRVYSAANALPLRVGARPTAPERSGSPASTVTWESLGNAGQQFVSGGPQPAALTAFTGRPAPVPIRVYAGLDQAATPTAIADVVVAELVRTRAFDRAVLAVGTATGTGWLDTTVTDTLEYLYNGDTAIASMQYADLPSWIDQVRYPGQAQEAGRALFNRVYAAVQERPVGSRPRLVAFGESLGAFGGQTAFAGVDDMLARVDAALWEGTPSLTQPWRAITDRRDPGSPQRLPVYRGGEHVRFTADGSGLDDPAWAAPRVVYLQHGSDPVVWWSTNLVLRRPDWLREPRAPDVDPAVTWLPVITFLQLTGDLLHAYDVPPGHGHHYGLATADCWAAVLRPPGWTDADTARLRAAVPPD